MVRKPLPNDLFRAARNGLPSPSGAPRPMSRQELAEAVNAYLHREHSINERLTQDEVGRIERGQTRWPGYWRRLGLRAVLGATSDADLGFYFHRAVPGSVAPPAAGPLNRTVSASEQEQLELAEGATIDVVRLAGAASFGMLPRDLTRPPEVLTREVLPARIEQPHVEALRDSIQHFENADHRYGGGLVRAAMAGQFAWAYRVAQTASMTSQMRQGWQSAAARLGDLLGWACFDAGYDDMAQQCFLVALQLAGEAADPQQRAHTATSFSRQLTYLGDTRRALDIVNLARMSWRELPPLGRCVIGIVEARAYGRRGEVQECLRAVGDCDEHYAAHSTGDDRPTWNYYADEGQVLGDAGHALFDLVVNSANDGHAGRTIERLEAAYATHPPEASRSRALTALRIAHLKARPGDLEEACMAARQGVSDARGVWSRRVADDLRALYAVLGRGRSSAQVAGIRTQISRLLADIC